MPTPPATYGQHTLEVLPANDTPMPLKCSGCGKVRKHKVGRIIVDPRYAEEIAHLEPVERLRHLKKIHWEKWVSFTGYFVCPCCGSGGPWKFPADAKREMAWKMISFATTGPESAGIFVGRLTLFDGTAPRTCFDGVAHLNRLIEAEPTNAYLWNRLGNLYASAEENDLALPAFEKAHELEPRCLETLHSLGAYWFEKGDLSRSASYFHQMLRSCRTGIWRNDRLKENVVLHSLELLAEMNQRSGGAISLFPEPDSAAAPHDPSQPPVLYLSTFDMAKQADRDRLVNLFLHGAPNPKEQHSQWQRERSTSPPVLRPLTADRGVGRNDPCPCGSGRKFKHCCYRR